MAKFYDLTQPLYHDCPGWATYPPVSVTRNYRSAVDGYNAETVTFNTHAGTHIDVPFHFFDQGETVEKVNLENFAGEGVFLDLRDKVTADSAIGVDLLKPFKDRIKPGCFVLLNTGWSSKRAISEQYLYKWPYLDGPGAEFLVSLGIKGVGIDGLSIGGWGPEKARPCHLVLLKKKVVIIEEVLFPEEVMDGKNHYVMAFPLLITGCGGCPVRLVAADF
jgi:kynurenine formamidase